MQLELKSLEVSAGFLEQARIEFAKELTCIIGARGTCKSTVVETIRFAFNSDPEKVRTLVAPPVSNFSDSESPSARGLIRATLGEGTARCTVIGLEHAMQSRYSVERRIDTEPQVFRDGVQQVDGSDILRAVEIYSQGDLQRIAEQPQRRLQLIERAHREQIASLAKERQAAEERLRTLGPQIRRLVAEIEPKKSMLRSLDAYRRDLDQIQKDRPTLSAELASQRDRYLERKQVMEQARGLLSRRSSLLETLKVSVRDKPLFASMSERLATLDTDTSQALAAAFSKLAQLIDQLEVSLAGFANEGVAEMITALEQEVEAKNQAYYELRRQEVEVNEVLKREDTLKSEIARLLLIEAEVEDYEGRLAILGQERADLRHKIQVIDDQLYQVRLAEVEQINDSFGDFVLLTLHQGTQTSDFRKAVSDLLEGSRIRSQDEVAADLATRIQPSELVDIVEAGDARRLADALQRDLGQMTRLVSFLVDNPKLYNLEGLLIPDWLEITMFVEGEAKPISQLSKGQMATALLPLILRPAPYPLIFDQPEDDLDNAFVFDKLISRIRELKRERQLIFVTHNANIPVLGEAESVIVMAMRSPSKANPPIVGNVDEARQHILKLLEGGAEAFRKRQERYGTLVA